MRADHERLDDLLRQLEEQVTTGAAAVLDTLDRFSHGLVHHMTWEDNQLFPAVKGVANAKERRSIESLEVDHERLRETLSSLKSSLIAGDDPAARALVSWLGTLLKGHNYDEEHGVYVEADRLLDRAERRRLIDQFKKAP